MLLQQSQQSLLSRIIWVKINFGRNIKSIQPHPLRAIMVTEPMGCLNLRTVVTIVIVGQVQRLVDFGQSRHAHWFRVKQVRLYIGQIRPCMFGSDNLWR